jgi:hypothetical protein
MVDMRNIHNTLHRNTERKKSVGRPRGRWLLRLVLVGNGVGRPELV